MDPRVCRSALYCRSWRATAAGVFTATRAGSDGIGEPGAGAPVGRGLCRSVLRNGAYRMRTYGCEERRKPGSAAGPRHACGNAGAGAWNSASLVGEETGFVPGRCDFGLRGSVRLRLPEACGFCWIRRCPLPANKTAVVGAQSAKVLGCGDIGPRALSRPSLTLSPLQPEPCLHMSGPARQGAQGGRRPHVALSPRKGGTAQGGLPDENGV